MGSILPEQCTTVVCGEWERHGRTLRRAAANMYVSHASDLHTCKLSIQGDEMRSLDGCTYFIEGLLEILLGDVHHRPGRATHAPEHEADSGGDAD